MNEHTKSGIYGLADNLWRENKFFNLRVSVLVSVEVVIKNKKLFHNFLLFG